MHSSARESLNNCVPVIWGKLCALLVVMLWSTLMGHGQTRKRTTGRKSGFRRLKSSYILSLVGVFVFWHPMAKAQFSPIPLSGGPLVKMTADFQRPYIYAIQAPAVTGQNGNLLFINTTNDSIDKTLVIGVNPTDLTINVAEVRPIGSRSKH